MFEQWRFSREERRITARYRRQIRASLENKNPEESRRLEADMSFNLYVVDCARDEFACSKLRATAYRLDLDLPPSTDGELWEKLVMISWSVAASASLHRKGVSGCERQLTRREAEDEKFLRGGGRQ
ncbi:MAG: hypothetical protein ACLPXT_09365 [Terracidiphilus sp.]